MRLLRWAGLLVLFSTAAAMLHKTREWAPDGPELTYTVRRGELVVTVTEHGLLESEENYEIKCKLRGRSTITWVIENGSFVKPGDVLMRLDTRTLEDAVAERTKYAYWSKSTAEWSRANTTRAELAISEYLEGRYLTQLMSLQKDLAIAEANLRTAVSMLDYAKDMAKRGYLSQLELEQRQFAVKRAELAVQAKKAEIEVLQNYTKAMELERLKGQLEAAKARLAADEERAKLDAFRRDLALEELKHCMIKADRAGLVIYPRTARWRFAPEIDVGATVYKDQVLLIMPDLSKMQVKLGFLEKVVKRIKVGMAAKVTLPDQVLEGTVSYVADVAKPAAWWTGNVVRYDATVRLPQAKNLRPGMSAEVEVTVAEYEDVLTVPVAAVVDTDEGHFCWIKTTSGLIRQAVKLGDTNGAFTIVEEGLREGDRVVLNPTPLEQELAREGEPTRSRAADTGGPT
jgi:multidrug efflux pump subunit AcrA (membrane-fusion protein)